MYTAVSDISYIAKSVVLGEGKRLGGVNMHGPQISGFDAVASYHVGNSKIL